MPARATEAELRRALKVAAACTPPWIVEVTREGAIRILPPQAHQAEKDPIDEWLAKHGEGHIEGRA